MLVLSRKPAENIVIGDDIVITVVRITSSAVRLGITAPKDMKIVRQELASPSAEVAPGSETSSPAETTE